MNEKFYVQETIGGWKQNAIFSGSYNECEEYLSDLHNGSYAIVSSEEYTVDYL